MYGFRFGFGPPKANVSLYTGKGGFKSMGQSPSYGSFSKGQARAAFSFSGYGSQFKTFKFPTNVPGKLQGNVFPKCFSQKEKSNVPGKLQGNVSPKCFSQKTMGSVSPNEQAFLSRNGASQDIVFQKSSPKKGPKGFGNLLREKMLQKVQSQCRSYSFKGFQPNIAILRKFEKKFPMVGKGATSQHWN